MSKMPKLENIDQTYYIFKDKGERFSRVHNVMQSDDVGMFQFLEQ